MPTVLNAPDLNTRDLGGLPLAGGRTLAPGLVHRAAAVRAPVPPICAALRLRHQQVHFIDLRAAREVDGAHDDAGVVVHRHPVTDPDPVDVAPSQRDEDYFVAQYLRSVEAALPAVRALFDVLASGAGPAVIGCRLGKDRTGVVSMMFLRLIGVPEKWIAHDFAATALSFTADLEWVETYAARRGENPLDVLRRCTLSPVVALRVLRSGRLHDTRLRESARIPPATLRRAREILSTGGDSPT